MYSVAPFCPRKPAEERRSWWMKLSSSSVEALNPDSRPRLEPIRIARPHGRQMRSGSPVQPFRADDPTSHDPANDDEQPRSAGLPQPKLVPDLPPLVFTSRRFACHHLV